MHQMMNRATTRLGARPVPELSYTEAELDRLADLLAERVAARVAARAPTTPELLTLTEAGKRLGWHAKTVRRRIASGDLEAVTVEGKPKVRSDRLEEYVERLKRVGERPRRAPRAPARRRYDFLHDGPSAS
jgi:excisionase family DNA binding protein